MIRKSPEVKRIKAIGPKLACFRRILVVVFLSAITAGRAQPHNNIRLNGDAFEFAAQLIKQGHAIVDSRGGWREHRSSADEESKFIRIHGFTEYAKWHLGIDERYPENTKRRYKFPYGDFKSVHRCGLLAVKARAHQYGYIEIENAAAELEREIRNQPRINTDSHGFRNSSVLQPCKSVALTLPGR